MKIFDAGLNKGCISLIINHLNVSLIMFFDGFLEEYALLSKKEQNR